MRILVAGEDPSLVEAARSGLAAQGADAEGCAGDLASVASAARAGPPPAAVIALGGNEDALRAGLDPLGLAAGPPVVSAAELATGTEFGSVVARRLRALVDLHTMRARQRELEGVIAAQAVSRGREVQSTQLDGLRRLAQAAEYRDDNTREHAQRVGQLAGMLARRVGLGDRMVFLVRNTAPLHDIGKIAIPDSILTKPGRLSEEEFEVVKTHALLGARVLSGGESELLEVAERIVRHHHERWDGNGYPDGLQGAKIPTVARIAHLADVFDVLVHERPYKDSWSVEAATEEIRAGAGTQFDPEIVEAFLDLGPRMWEVDPQPA